MNHIKDQIHYNIEDHNVRGQGVGVAIMDTGICFHPDFDKRITAFHDVINHRQFPYDDNGHGTHVERPRHNFT